MKRTMRTGNGLNRRDVVKALGVAGVGLSMPAIWSSEARAQSNTLVVRDPAGTWRPALTDAYYAPFEKATGVKINAVAAEHDPTAMIKAQVDTRNFQWNVAVLTLAAHAVLPADKYFEELDMTGPDVAELIPQARQATWMGHDVYATVLAYSKDKFGKAPPQSWNDFWDTGKFRGRRAMRKHAFDTIEPTLLADGVPADKLYPLDLDRAFRKLDKVKKNVDVWWTGGAQASQLIQSGEVDLCITWNGRAQAAIDGGANYGLMWNQAVWGLDGWVIPKGNPQVKLAREFVKFCANARRQAVFSKALAYGPVNPKAFAFISKERADILPTNPDYFKTMVLQDPVGWGPVKDKAVEMFDAWVARS